MSSNGKEWADMLKMQQEFAKMSPAKLFTHLHNAVERVRPFKNVWASRDFLTQAEFEAEYLNKPNNNENKNPLPDQRYGAIYGYDPQL